MAAPRGVPWFFQFPMPAPQVAAWDDSGTYALWRDANPAAEPLLQAQPLPGRRWQGHRVKRWQWQSTCGQSPAPARASWPLQPKGTKPGLCPAPDGQQSATLQMRGADSPSPRGPAPTHPGDHSVGTFLHQAAISQTPPPRHQPFICCLLSLLPSFRSGDPLTSVREEGRAPHGGFALPRCELRAGRGRGGGGAATAPTPIQARRNHGSDARGPPQRSQTTARSAWASAPAVLRDTLPLTQSHCLPVGCLLFSSGPWARSGPLRCQPCRGRPVCRLPEQARFSGGTTAESHRR